MEALILSDLEELHHKYGFDIFSRLRIRLECVNREWTYLNGNSNFRHPKYLIHEERNKDLEYIYRPEAKKINFTCLKKDFGTSDLNMLQHCTREASFMQHFQLYSSSSKLYLEQFQELTNQLPCWHTPIKQHKIFEHQTAYGDTMFASMNSGNPMRKIKRHNSDDFKNFNSTMKCSKDHVLLLLLTLMVMGTLVAASRYATVHNQPQERQDFVFTLPFILCKWRL